MPYGPITFVGASPISFVGSGPIHWNGSGGGGGGGGSPSLSGPTGLQNIIPGYLYTQYNDDDNLQGMMAAFNAYAQAYLDYMNALNLPVYTSQSISGPLLDWVAQGLYGMLRPGLPTKGTPARGPFNTWLLNSLPFNTAVAAQDQTYYATTDDIFRRVLTWQFYKGDGRVFSIRWLKRRVFRFLNGVNGTDVDCSSTSTVSVTLTAPRAATITTPNTPTAMIFKTAVEAGVLELPFQIAWDVALV